jgi:hypothetical protein
MPGKSDALKGKVSDEALDDLEGFTRHNGWNDDDSDHWRDFIVRTYREGRRADRDALREHLKATRPDDSEKQTEDLVDEYEEGHRILKIYDRHRGA